ncbi:MAG: glycosyltransferase family 2 protein [Planctomycetota bacterium]|jgi:glycosyltransferase involved in cell wall biosynthesis
MAPEPASPELSVVLPVFNEEGNLRPLMDELLPVLRGLDRAFEIVFVDDGSTDGSPDVLAELSSEHDEVAVWRLDRNHGLSSALHAGFASARAPVIATMDADLQNDPADLPLLLGRLDDQDLVCGWRKDRRDPWLKRVSSRIANGWRNRRTGDAFHDITCPLKVFRAEVRDAFPSFDGMHRFYPTLARMAGFRVVEVPVGHRPRHSGVSKYGVGNRLRKGLEDLRAIRWMQRHRLTYRKERVS